MIMITIQIPYNIVNYCDLAKNYQNDRNCTSCCLPFTPVIYSAAMLSLHCASSSTTATELPYKSTVCGGSCTRRPLVSLKVNDSHVKPRILLGNLRVTGHLDFKNG